MSRMILLAAAAMLGAPAALSGCASHRGGEEPAWLEEGIRAAEAAQPGFPSQSAMPTYRPSQTSMSAWQAGVSGMAALRAQVLSDPALAELDADDDAETFSQKSREDAERDLARQAVPDDER